MLEIEKAPSIPFQQVASTLALTKPKISFIPTGSILFRYVSYSILAKCWETTNIKLAHFKLPVLPGVTKCKIVTYGCYCTNLGMFDN